MPIYCVFALPEGISALNAGEAGCRGKVAVCPKVEPVEDADDDPQAARFCDAAELTPEAVAAIAEQVRVRVLRWFARSDLIEPDDAREMLAWDNSGFSLDAAVRVGAHDRAGLERLLRYRARPPFALERLRRIPTPAKARFRNNLYGCTVGRISEAHPPQATTADALPPNKETVYLTR
ncbi:transposase, partial [Thiohalocapsa marina]|uniref:transposase n=1 Tax=Thiohalocapsa marina TaxID=424902 RepID=UPI0036D95742